MKGGLQKTTLQKKKKKEYLHMDRRLVLMGLEGMHLTTCCLGI